MAEASESSWTTRGFRAERFTFCVATAAERLCKQVELLFSDLDEVTDPSTTFTLIRDEQGTRLLGPEPLQTAARPALRLTMSDLVTAVNRQMLDAGGDRLHLHAGAVSSDGTGVMISAASGQGKTTLVAALCLRGWEYLSDEAVSVAAGDRTIRAFPKPISIKPGIDELLPELAIHRPEPDSSDTRLWHLPMGKLGVTITGSTVPELVVFLSRAHEAEEPAWEPISPADAVVNLVEQSFDFERYGADGLIALAELCARARCVHIQVGAPARTATVVEQLVADSWARELEVKAIEIAPHSDVNDKTASVMLGEEAVLRHLGSGQVLSLNAAGAQLWLTLCNGEIAYDQLAPEEIALVNQLTALDLLRNRPAGD